MHLRFYTCHIQCFLPNSARTSLCMTRGTCKMIRKQAIQCLVGGLEHFLFFHMLGMSSSQLTHSYFSDGVVYHQSDVNRSGPIPSS